MLCVSIIKKNKTMKVLWFTNTMSCYTPQGIQNKHGYNGGGWISSAEKIMRKQENVKLAVSFMADYQPTKVEQNGVIYYPIPNKHIPKLSKITRILKLLLGDLNYEKDSWQYYLEHFRHVVDDFNPDIIHVWGSEFHFGLVWKVTQCPVILHLQGIIGPYINAYMPAGMSWMDIRREARNPMKRMRCLREEKAWRNSAYREQEIFRGITAALGRTKWDNRVMHCINPGVAYYHVDEILRDDFYKKSERHLPERLTIITTISSPPYKGFDLVLKTAKILKQNMNMNFEWKCYGNINPTFIERQVGIRHQDVGVMLMGVASVNELITAELNATLYFHSSYIDNSPNSLCEAQMLGLPIVATNVGGIPSLVRDGIDGYLVPANDPYQAACFIERFFNDRTRNIEMGKKGQVSAYSRHNPKNVVEQIIDAYKKVTR